MKPRANYARSQPPMSTNCSTAGQAMSSVPSRCLLAVLLLLLSPFAARADCPPKLADKGHRLNGHPLKARWPQVQLIADTVLSELGAYEENGCNSTLTSGSWNVCGKRPDSIYPTRVSR